ncbi:putative ABC transporter permease [Candidatus Saccharibacteria bacterium]|nr:putative ABC transporter permease [Candidatus Saccharibacteria bacterium]
MKRIGYFGLLWLFLSGSVLGFVIEGLWSWYRFGAWMNHSATVWGPLCIIYGLGLVVLFLLSRCFGRLNFVLRFVLFALCGAVLELVSGLAQNLVFGSRSWDYGGAFWGFINLEMTMFWGILGMLFYYLLYPLLTWVLGRLEGRLWRILGIIATVWLMMNFTMTSLAVWRWGARLAEQPARNGVDSYLDTHYGDNRMRSIFPNMEFRKFGD